MMQLAILCFKRSNLGNPEQIRRHVRKIVVLASYGSHIWRKEQFRGGMKKAKKRNNKRRRNPNEFRNQSSREWRQNTLQKALPSSLLLITIHRNHLNKISCSHLSRLPFSPQHQLSKPLMNYFLSLKTWSNTNGWIWSIYVKNMKNSGYRCWRQSISWRGRNSKRKWENV